MCVYIYVYVCMYVCVYIYMHMSVYLKKKNYIILDIYIWYIFIAIIVLFILLLQ